MTFFGPCMTEKNGGRSEGKENIGEFPVTMGGRGPSDARFSRTVRAWVRGFGLELNPSEASPN